MPAAHTDSHTGQTYVVVTKKNKHKIRSKENPDTVIGVATRAIQQYLDAHPDLVRDGRVVVDEVRKGVVWRRHLEKMFRAMSVEERARSRDEYYGEDAENERKAKAVARAEAAKEVGRWAWHDGRWYIRYTGKATICDTIRVQRKDGTVSDEVLGERVSPGYWITLAQAKQDARNESALRLVDKQQHKTRLSGAPLYDADKDAEIWVRETQFADMRGEES